jgi:hypothetical protein
MLRELQSRPFVTVLRSQLGSKPSAQRLSRSDYPGFANAEKPSTLKELQQAPRLEEIDLERCESMRIQPFQR